MSLEELEREYIKDYIKLHPHEARSCGLTKLWAAFQALELEGSTKKKIEPRHPKGKHTIQR